jgi:hypothetical protein
MDGSLALPISRRWKLTPLIEDEIEGRSPMPPGLRLIDILGIRFIATDGPLATAAFRTFWHQPDLAYIEENTAALPRFQVYGSHISVESTDAAIDTIAHWKTRTLVIENPPGAGHKDEMADGTPMPDEATPLISFKVLRAKSTSYLFDVSADRPGWLFLADANYPGWTATLDGKDVPLFSAQVLGKAVGIPAGRHTLTIVFRSASFLWGLWISIVSAALTLLAVLYERRALP